MAYNYYAERNQIFTEENQRDFLIVRDHVRKLLGLSGAVRMLEAAFGCQLSGSSWTIMAYVDRLVELGEIREITKDVVGQDRVFVNAKQVD